MKKRIVKAVLAMVLFLGFTVAAGLSGQEAVKKQEEQTQIYVFQAASLNKVMTELIETYQKLHPEVKIICNADSSGTLLAQIEEGYECDIFFSAAQEPMDQLQEDGMLAAGTRKNFVNNQVAVITRKDSDSKVTGLENLSEASNIALAGGSVPVGRYTRQALIHLGVLARADDPASITTSQVSEALGGVEISEQDNVSKVLLTVLEGSCEVGTVYYSDICGYEKELNILQVVDYDLTGDVIYPIAQINKPQADHRQIAAAEDFMAFVLSDQAKEVLKRYYFDTNVE